MPAAFQCSLVTPERSVLDAEATYADLPAHDGQMGVMSGRAPMLVQLGVGPLRLQLHDGGAKRFVLDGGYAQMQDDRLTLLCERAWSADDVTAEQAGQLLTEAEALPMTSTDEVDNRTHDLAIAKHLTQLARG